MAGVYTKVSPYSQFIADVLCGVDGALDPPVLGLEVNGNKIRAAWHAISGATGYQLFYAPYPAMSPIESVDLGNALSISGQLPSGAAYCLAVVAYEGVCLDYEDRSNIESFRIS